MFRNRAGGILLHVSSLPSRHGIGDLGPEAYAFVDFLAAAGLGYWQVLPLNPTIPDANHSPYDATSSFAGNPFFISPELLSRRGLIGESDLLEPASAAPASVDYGLVAAARRNLLVAAYERFSAAGDRSGFEMFCREQGDWLEDFAAFTAIRGAFPDQSWWEWPDALRRRREKDIAAARESLSDEIRREKFFQYLFFDQWFALKHYANGRGVRIIGDIPFYVGHDSADVWSSPEAFMLDDSKRPRLLSGVPPDRFSDSGQLWGNPVYDWARLAEHDYAWWIRRISHNLRLFDVVRIDHFRGFAASWHVPAGSETAVDGEWAEGPGARFFTALFRRHPSAQLIAEDLGTITADVRELMRMFELPGMKVLLFAFDDGGENPYLPHNHVPNCVLYTGTHDNNTLRGWFENEATEGQKRNLFDYLGREVSEEDLCPALIRLAMMSVSRLVVIPMQDVLGLGQEARMNHPATRDGNWKWRMLPGEPAPGAAEQLFDMTRRYGRE